MELPDNLFRFNGEFIEARIFGRIVSISRFNSYDHRILNRPDDYISLVIEQGGSHALYPEDHYPYTPTLQNTFFINSEVTFNAEPPRDLSKSPINLSMGLKNFGNEYFVFEFSSLKTYNERHDNDGLGVALTRVGALDSFAYLVRQDVSEDTTNDLRVQLINHINREFNKVKFLRVKEND